MLRSALIGIAAFGVIAGDASADPLEFPETVAGMLRQRLAGHGSQGDV